MNPFIGQLILFAGNFAPRGWAFCAGQLLPIAQNTALFSILGTTYGGDGRTTFALPDLRGRIPVGEGQGPGQPRIALGEKLGTEQTTLLSANMPAATVSIPSSGDDANADEPNGKAMAVVETPIYANAGTGTMAHGTVSGQNLPFNNIQPVLGLNYIIALQGTFPSRS